MRNPVFIFLLAGIFFLASCSVEKRHYRRGFYISSRSLKHADLFAVSDKQVPDSMVAFSSENKLSSEKKPVATDESFVSEKSKPFSAELSVKTPQHFIPASSEAEQPQKPIAFKTKKHKHKLSVNTDFTVYLLAFFLLCAWLFRRFGASVMKQEPLNAGIFFCFILIVSFALALPLQLIFLGFGLGLALNNPDNFSVGLTIIYTLIGLVIAALFVLELILIWNLLYPFAFIKTVHLILLGLWVLVMILGISSVRKSDLMEEDGVYFGKKKKL